jgi:hypothetical protein
MILDGINPKIMNVIDFKSLERDAGGKPPTLFLISLHRLEQERLRI